jgi:hypothetical protein
MQNRADYASFAFIKIIFQIANHGEKHMAPPIETTKSPSTNVPMSWFPASEQSRQKAANRTKCTSLHQVLNIDFLRVTQTPIALITK